jgi:hypothetical protein
LIDLPDVRVFAPSSLSAQTYFVEQRGRSTIVDRPLVFLTLLPTFVRQS